MILTGLCDFISSLSRVGSNGKTYINVNLLDSDGQVFTVGTDQDLLPKLETFKRYTCYFDYRTYQGNSYLRLVDVRPLQPSK